MHLAFINQTSEHINLNFMSIIYCNVLPKGRLDVIIKMTVQGIKPYTILSEDFVLDNIFSSEGRETLGVLL